MGKSGLPSSSEVTELYTDAGYGALPVAERDRSLLLSQHFDPEGLVDGPLDWGTEGALEYLQGKVLLVLAEPVESRRDSCLVDCDDLGSDRSYRLRFLLLPQAGEVIRGQASLSAELLLRLGFQVGELPVPWEDIDAAEGTEGLFTLRHRFFQQFYPQLPRYGWEEETPAADLGQIQAYGDFMRAYLRACEAGIAAIEQSFPALFRLFSPFLHRFHPDPTDFTSFELEGTRLGLGEWLRTKLARIVPAGFQAPGTPAPPAEVGQAEAQYAIQYFYDYLAHLIGAWHELAETAFDLMEDCAPPAGRFPTFLMLGRVENAEACATPSAYRSHFSQPPIYNDNAIRLQQVKHQYERLRRLVSPAAFNLLPYFDTPLKLTPSFYHRQGISELAIPYYLDYGALYRYWNHDRCRKGIPFRQPSYFLPEGQQRAEQLLLRHDAHDFYRVEGHLGSNVALAVQGLRRYQQRHNLAFDIVALKLDVTGQIDDFTLYGEMDDLEADFEEAKDRFAKIWDENQARWQNNVLVQTLRRRFFERDQLAAFRYSELSSDILRNAAHESRYAWVANPNGSFRLELRDESGNPIARFAEDVSFADDNGNALLDTGTLQQQYIRQFATCFAISLINYSLTLVNSDISGESFTQFLFRVNYLTRDEVTWPDNSTDTVALRSTDTLGIEQVANQTFVLTSNTLLDFDTVYGLMRDLDAGRDPDLNENLTPADMVAYWEIKGVFEAYQQRLERRFKLHLFHEFAKQHPGLEPRGGVPKGGTFVMVYVDGEEIVGNIIQSEQAHLVTSRGLQPFIKTPPVTDEQGNLLEDQRRRRELITSQSRINQADLVVGDFCLPYRVGGDGPVVSYVLAKPRPIVLLEKMVFCEDDETAYEFILDPMGGTLKGEGVSTGADGAYYFRPSDIQREAMGDPELITFTYVIEGSYDTLTVQVYPEPSTDFSLTQTDFCVNDEPVTLSLRPEDDHLELLSIRVGGQAMNRFDPGAYAGQQLPVQVDIQALVRDRRTGCENTVSRTLTVYPQPDAGFSFSVAPQNEGFCIDADQIELQPNSPSESQGFTLFYPGGLQINEDLLEPSRLDGVSLPAQVIIEHRARSSNPAACEAVSRRTVTIYDLPVADFTLATAPNDNGVYEFCANDEPVAIQGGGANDTFALTDADGNTLSGGLLSDPWRFAPAQVFPDGPDGIVSLTLTRRVSGPGGCESRFSQSLILQPIAEPGTFELEAALPEANRGTFQVRASNVQLEGQANWQLEPPPASGPRFSADGWVAIYQYLSSSNPNGIPLDTLIRVTLVVTPQGGGCSSAPTEETVAVPFGTEQTFLGWEGEGGGLSLFDGAAISDTELGDASQYFIAAQTLPQEVGSVILRHTAPDGSQTDSGPLTTAPYQLDLPGRPAIGVHQLAVETYAQAGGSGAMGGPYQISFTVTNPDLSRPRNLAEAEAAATPQLGGQLLNRRREQFKAKLNELGEANQSIGDSKPFKLASMLLMAAAGIDEAESVKRYQAFVKSLLASYRQSSDERKAELNQVMALTTAGLFDRLVAGNIARTVRTDLQAALSDLKEAGIDLNGVKQTWEGDALSDAFDTDSLNDLIQ
jgi:hypothetical protein